MYQTIQAVFSILFFYWWLTLPAFLITVYLFGYAEYTKAKFIAGMKWTLLEIRLPPDVERSPKIAEHIYNGIHAIYTGPVKWKKRFFEGKILEWFSFEIVSNSGDIHFYIRTPEGHRNLIESLIFSQYPDAEVKVADQDYVELLPEKPAFGQDYEIFGTELEFTKDDVYPLKTYVDFEEEGGKDELTRTEPLAPLFETMSVLEPDEHLWLQFIIRPTGTEWTEKSKAAIDKILGRKAKPKDSEGVAKMLLSIDKAVFKAADSEEKKEEKEPSFQALSPRQKNVVEAIENKTSKHGFQGAPRFVYIAAKAAFNRSRISSVTGMFKQLYANDLNSFKPNKKTITTDDGILSGFFPSGRGFNAGERELKRKFKIYKAYRTRKFVNKPVILNTEEMATFYHLPGAIATTPLLPRVETVKGQPPSALPTK